MNKINQTRYARQIALDEIGSLGQAALMQAKVLCVGAGGLGCPALLYLAAAGVGHLTIIDPDTVDETNLQRQVLFTQEDCGQLKALAAKRRLQMLNPEVTFEAKAEALTDKNAETLFQAHDIIIDGADNFSTKYLINDAAVKTGKPVIYGAIQGFDGQVSVWDAAHGPCYRCLYPTPPKATIRNCAEAGVIGAVAGVVGVTQAMQAIALIVRNSTFEPLIGKLWTIDTRTMQTQIFSVPKNSGCPTCSIARQQIKLTYEAPQCHTGLVQEIGAANLPSSALLIDVREIDEWNNGHIAHASHWPLSKLRDGSLPDLPKNQEIVLYCQRGIRSLTAAQLLLSAGYMDVKSLKGGFDAWPS